MKNKTKRIYGRLLALSLSALLIMTGLSVTALAAGENLLTAIPYFDPTFDTVDLSQVKSGLKMKHAALVEDTEMPGNKYIQIQQVDGQNGYIEIHVPVEPEENYNFSFKMRNSLEKALQLGVCSFYAVVDGQEKELAYVSNSIIDYKNGNYLTGFGNGWTHSPTIDEEKNKFGIARADEDAKSFREITINFTTPPENERANVKSVKLLLECLQNDPMLAVDDFSVVKTGKKPNRVFNGDFEAIQNDKSSPEASGIFHTKVDGASFELLTESNGNHYIQGITKNWSMWSIDSKAAGVLQGRKSGTRYKMSFRAKSNTSPVAGSPKVSLRLNNSTGSGNTLEFSNNFLSNEWKTYTAYINFTEPARDDKLLAGGSAQFALTTDIYNKICVDDIYAWYDESGIGFYETLNEDIAHAPSVIGSEYGNTVKKEVSVEATTIEALTVNGDSTLKVRAHYLPKETWGDYDTESKTYSLTVEPSTEITLLAAVYKHEGNKKTLVSVEVDSGTTKTNGEALDIVGEVTVPKAINGETYTVEAMAWDMNGMKPIMDKAVLN